MTVGSPAGSASTGSPMGAVDPGALLMQAVQLHQAGQLDAAGRLYEAVLRIVPEQPDALHLLGVLALQAGRPGDAVARIRRAIMSRPESATFHANLGVALQAVGRLADARESLERAAELDPGNADALFNLGVTFQTLGLLDTSVERYEQALVLVPGHPGARRNLGNALHALGRHAEAAEAYRAVLALGPSDAGLLGSLGASLAALGRNAEAVEAFEAAVTLAPADADVCLNLAMALHQAARYDAAIEAYRRALALRPDHLDGWHSLGRALNADAQYDEAVDCYRRALALLSGTKRSATAGTPPKGSQVRRARAAKAAQAKARAARPAATTSSGAPTAPAASSATTAQRERRLGLLRDLGSALYVAERRVEAAEVLRTIAELTPDEPEAWRNYGVTLSTSGSMEEAAAVLEKTVALDPSSSDYLSNYIYVLDMLDSATLEQTFQARRDWNARHALPLAALIQPHANRPDPERRLRVGYVSADFRRHSAAATFLTILQHHDPAVMEVVCYSNNLYEDDLTERFKACASVWRRVGALSDDELAAQIRADRVDVLVDLSGHSRGNRLLTFARKPAPVQVTGWGYATGTGLDAIDAFMADPVVVPPEEERFYAERVVHLPNVVCYSPPPAPPAISLLPALANGYVTFGSFNRVVKITPAVLALWAQVLLAVPGSRLVLKPSLQDTPATRERLVGPLTQRGIDAARVDILGTSPHHEHLTSFGTIDVQLDPFPHTGGVSTLDGLLMGVPCVTLLGERVAGRLTASFQRLLGLDDLIARTPEEYVEIAVGLAGDLARLARERATLRERLLASPIRDADAYARAVEAAYRGLWRDWCARWARGEDRAARSATTSEDSE